MYSLTTGNDNTNSGYGGMFSLTTGNNNTNSGFEGMYSLTTGGFNTALGYQAGRYVTGGSVANQTSNNSLYLGANTMAQTDGDGYETVVGPGATGSGSNTVTLGRTSDTVVIPATSFSFNGKTCTIVGMAISCS
jgi:hypothetical protein